MRQSRWSAAIAGHRGLVCRCDEPGWLGRRRSQLFVFIHGRRFAPALADARLFGWLPSDFSELGEQASSGSPASSRMPRPENTGSTNMALDSGPPHVPHQCMVFPMRRDRTTARPRKSRRTAPSGRPSARLSKAEVAIAGSCRVIDPPRIATSPEPSALGDPTINSPESTVTPPEKSL